MKHIKRRIVPVTVRAVRDRVLTFTASTDSVARDDEIIRADAWDLDAYRSNPVVLWGHMYHEPPIGRALDLRIIEPTKSAGGRLEADIEFAGLEQLHELAEQIHMLYRDGFLRAVSVGYIPRAYQDLADDQREELGLPAWGRVVTSAELLEISGVSVPADTGALMQAGIDPEHSEALVALRGIAREEDRPAIDMLVKDNVLTDEEKSRTLHEDRDAILVAIREMGAEITATIRADTEQAVRSLSEHFGAPPRSAPDLAPDEPTEDDEERDLYGIAEALTERLRGGRP